MKYKNIDGVLWKHCDLLTFDRRNTLDDMELAIAEAKANVLLGEWHDVWVDTDVDADDRCYITFKGYKRCTPYEIELHKAFEAREAAREERIRLRQEQCDRETLERLKKKFGE
jgi:hypothetical protein